jgi:hypothetical protein
MLVANALCWFAMVRLKVTTVAEKSTQNWRHANLKCLTNMEVIQIYEWVGAEKFYFINLNVPISNFKTQ